MAAATQMPPEFAFASSGPSYSLAPGFRAKSILESQRFQTLNFKEQYFLCEQHAWKMYDFDGSPVTNGPQPPIPYTQSDRYIPLRYRRPSSPEQLGKSMVDAFSSLLFGEGRWPALECAGDDDTEDYAEAVCEKMLLPAVFVEARNVGGSTGTVGVSWCIYEGNPRAEVHNAKHLFVHEWADRTQLIPSAVSECYRYPVDEYDAEKQAYVRNYYWHHRYWDMKQDGYFLPVKYDAKTEPEWIPDMDQWTEHGDGECHLVWLQNRPNGGEIDGKSDYEGLFDRLDTIDVIASVLAGGAAKNLDPTLILNVPEAMIRFGIIKKGSDNALAVGADGDAKYLELAGTSITAGLALLEYKKKSALNAAQCVLVDPDKIAASGVSSVAMKVAYAPMLAEGNKMRTQYGTKGILRIVDGVIRAVRARPDEALNLPPRKKVKEGGAPDEFELVERNVGKGENLQLKWPPYFEATPEDKKNNVTTAQAGAGGKAVISQQTAVEEAATAFGRNPDEEWKRVQAEKQAALKEAGEAFAGIDGAGGKVQVTHKLPDGDEMQFAGQAGPMAGGGAPPGGDDGSGGAGGDDGAAAGSFPPTGP